MKKTNGKNTLKGKYVKGGFQTFPNGKTVYVEDFIENPQQYFKDNTFNPTTYCNKHNPDGDKTKVRVLLEYVGNKQSFWKINQSLILNRIILSNIVTVVIPFAGSGSDFLTIAPLLIEEIKKSGKQIILVFNDLNTSIVNLLKKISSKFTRQQLIREVRQIILDQKELLDEKSTLEDYKVYHKLLVEELNKLEIEEEMNVRRAALFLVVMNTTFGGNYEWKNGKSRISISSDIKKFQGYSKVIEKIKLMSFYLGYFKVVIENKDYKKILKKYDGINTLFLIDPPYLQQDVDVLVSTKVTYGNPDFPHEECINMVKGLKGQFIYHNYRNNVQTKMFGEDKTIGHIEVHKAVNNTKSISTKKKPRCVEVIYFSTWNNETTVEETTPEVSTVETQPSVQEETVVEPTMVKTVPVIPTYPIVSIFPMVSMTPSMVINNNIHYRHLKVVIPFLKSVS